MAISRISKKSSKKSAKSSKVSKKTNKKATAKKSSKKAAPAPKKRESAGPKKFWSAVSFTVDMFDAPNAERARIEIKNAVKSALSKAKLTISNFDVTDTDAE